jgi:hypothetical protein
MARTDHLPIYKASYDLCLYLEQVVHGFSRYHKYTLGTDLRDAARHALMLVARANAQLDRVPTLLALRPELKTPFLATSGIDCVGWRTWWNRRVPRRRALANLQRKVQEFERASVRPAGAHINCVGLSDGRDAQAVERLQASLASYSGHLRPAAQVPALREQYSALLRTRATTACCSIRWAASSSSMGHNDAWPCVRLACVGFGLGGRVTHLRRDFRTALVACTFAARSH